MVSITRRELAAMGLATGITGFLASTRLASAAMAATVDDPLPFVDWELRPAAKIMLDEAKSFPPFSKAELPAMRQRMSASFSGPPLASVPYTKKTIAVGKDQPDVVIYVINARAGAKRPGILHTHGGGYVAGTAFGSVRDLQDVASALDCAIVTVEYRLAPETNFKGSIEDNYAGLKWLHDNVAELGVDPARIAVMGESAGGGHAALLAITARDRSEVPVAFQCLIYPMLDDRTGSVRPEPFPIGAMLWTANANKFGWRSFLGTEPGTSTVAAQAVPSRVESVKGLPPTFIGVGSIDLFVQENIAYANRLIAAGIQTELVIVPGAFHAFDVIAKETSVSKRFFATKLAALSHGLKSATAWDAVPDRASSCRQSFDYATG